VLGAPGVNDLARDHLSPEIERLQAEIARRFGYRLVGHRLELYAVPLSKQPPKI